MGDKLIVTEKVYGKEKSNPYTFFAKGGTASINKTTERVCKRRIICRSLKAVVITIYSSTEKYNRMMASKNYITMSYDNFVLCFPTINLFGKYRAGGTFGRGAFYGKIRECQGSVIPGIIA